MNIEKICEDLTYVYALLVRRRLCAATADVYRIGIVRKRHVFQLNQPGTSSWSSACKQEMSRARPAAMVLPRALPRIRSGNTGTSCSETA